MKKFKLIYILLAINIISCNKEDDTNEPEVLSEENKITDFQLPVDGTYVSGEIDQNSKIISFNTEGQDLNNLTPRISYSEKARISPAENIPQDFSSEVAYTIYAESGASEIYRIQVNNRPLSTEKKILSFKVNINETVLEAEINQDELEIYLDVGEFYNSINPEITVSEFASVELIEEEPDFSRPVQYLVMAEDGSSVIYELHVNKPKIEIAKNWIERLLFYPGAEIFIAGKFLNFNEEDNFYLVSEDGTMVYPEITERIAYDSDPQYQYYISHLKIPYSAPTGIYKLVIEIGPYITQFDGIDILNENVPRLTGTDKEEYQLNDTLVLSGENLNPYIMIPHDGSQYLIFDTGSGTIDIKVNETRTELRFVMDYRWYNFFGSRDVKKKIFAMGENSRVGESIEAIFK